MADVRIIVQNSLAEASGVVTGPNEYYKEFSGTGPSEFFNSVEGEYSVEWNKVGDYVTPTKQTKTLVFGEAWNVYGDYACRTCSGIVIRNGFQIKNVGGIPEWVYKDTWNLNLTVNLICWKSTTGDILIYIRDKNIDKCIGVIRQSISLLRGDEISITIPVTVDIVENDLDLEIRVLTYWGNKYYCEVKSYTVGCPFYYAGTIKALTSIPEGNYTICRGCNYVPPSEVLTGGGDEVVTFKNKKPADWTITFGDVEGYETPKSITKTLDNKIGGDVIDFYGEYNMIEPPPEEHTYIKAKTNIMDGHYYLYDEYKYGDYLYGKGSEFTEFEVDIVGNYVFICGSVEGYVPPVYKVINVVENTTTELIGEYKIASSPPIEKTTTECCIPCLLIIILLLLHTWQRNK